jgi:PKD repeat protein
VTLGAAGSYNASLTVSNDAGSDTFNFTLDVTNPAPPQVDDVQPQSGDEGAQLSFAATLSGGPVATYAWDFGGGAAPNTDSTAAPFVTLGTAGVYPASLTVSNAGGSDTFNFNLTVTLSINNPPTASFTATPQNGNPGDPVALDAALSSDSDGSIVKYEWDLDGDGTYEYDSTPQASAATALPNPAGTIDVSLRVTDNGGAQDEHTLTLSSLQQSWHSVFVHGTSNGIDTVPFLAELNGLPVIAFGEANLVGHVFITFAYTTTDDGSSGFSMTTATNDSPKALSLAAINGKPAIAYVEQSGSALKYAYSSMSDGSSGWSDLNVDKNAQFGKSASLALINGKPAIASYDEVNNILDYAYSTADDGSSGWTTVKVDGDNSVGSSLALIKGKPAIAYTTATAPDATELRYAYSSMDDGSSGWTSLTVPDTAAVVYSKISLQAVNGFPSVLWGSSSTKGISYSHSTVADGSSDWSTLDTNMGAPASGTYPQSLAFKDFPYSALISTGDQVSVGLNSKPDGTGDWTETVVDQDPAQGVTVAIINGQPAVAYLMTGFPEVRYAIYK